MCGGGESSGGNGSPGASGGDSYVDRLTRTIEANLANNNAGVRSGGSLYGYGGSPYGPGGNNPSPSANGPGGNNPNVGGGGSGMGRGGEDVGRPIGGGGIGSVPTPNVSGGRYDYVGAPAPQLPGSPTLFGPRGGAPLAGTGINYDPALTKAAIAIQGFEGFVPKAFWDVNAPRVGWSSDTITDPVTGKQRRVTMDDTISVEDANVDLNARIVGIQNTLAKTIGQEAWDNLSTGAKAAMTSVGYQYGTVPKSVVSAAQSGNPETVAKAISDLPSTPDRRAKEAKISLSDKFINAGLNVLPGLVHPALGLLNAGSGVVGGKQFSDLVRGSGDIEVNPTDPGSDQSQNQEGARGYGPYGDLTREEYQKQYGGADKTQETVANKNRKLGEKTPKPQEEPDKLPVIIPQRKISPVAPGTTPNTRKLSDEEYAALSPLEKAYYDMGISTYGTFTPEYNYFPNRQPIYLKKGGLVKGPGTETSDSVPALIGGKTPAALSDGEFVFTGRAVRGMGNGDRMEGARKLHQMMKKAEGNASKGSSRK